MFSGFLGLSVGFLAAQSAQTMYPCLTQAFDGGLGGSNVTITPQMIPDDYEVLNRKRRSLDEAPQGKIIAKRKFN